MLATILLVELGIESSYSCFKDQVVSNCQIRSSFTGDLWSKSAWTKECFDELVLLMETSLYVAPVASQWEGHGTAVAEAPILPAVAEDGSPHIDWYRARVNECVMMWHEATDETLDEQRGPNHPEYARSPSACHRCMS